MRTIYNILGVLVLTSVLYSCVRSNPILEPPVLPPGGKVDDSSLGATLKITVQHHKNNINSGMVYIKYAATSMPDMDKFDDSTFISTSPSYFDSLTQGDYYIYAMGIDPELEQGRDDVFGGAHFRIIDTLETTYDLYLQVDNEAHHEYRK